MAHKRNEEQHEVTAGIEVHQQLNTAKLFCACPSHIRDDPPDVEVVRSLRASAGESGELDLAASHELQKQKRFVYQAYSDSTCLIELDEEPVCAINSDALHVALQVAKLLNLTIVDEVHIMRKTVIDGSNTSGFQRTGIIGLNGHITVEDKKIRIEQLCLEEESAKIIERTSKADVYNLSRLGIPLLEITTGPDLHSAAQVKAVAAHIGMLLRSTEKVKRGLGTIRQDVNVSVPGGERVEIKGAQDLDNLGLLVDIEAQRQRALINIAQSIPKQQYSISDVTSIIAASNAKRLEEELQKPGSVAIGIKLTGWNETLGMLIAPGVRVGRELAGYAKAHGFGGLVHSSEDLTKYPLEEDTVLALRTNLQCADSDGWLFMVGERQKLTAFLQHVLIPRLNHFSVGVPKEVRKAESDGTTSYLRPMPGAARMYPETDVPPIVPVVSNIQLPELLTVKAKRIAKQYGISDDLAQQLTREGIAGVFEKWAATYNTVSPSLLANLLATKEREIKTRHGIDIDIITLGPEVLEKLHERKISASSVEEILVKLGRQEAVDFAHYAPIDDQQVKMVLAQLVKENPGAKFGLLMGKAMRQLEGKIDGKRVQELLAELGVQS